MKNCVKISSLFLLCASVICVAQFDADLDGDKYVGIEDLAIIGSYWLDHNNPGCNGDTGLDCRIDMEDIANIARQWQWMECVSSATASSRESASYAAYNAIDGNMSTRWSSAFEDNQWLLIDLGQLRNIYGLMIYWETAYARIYNVQISDDGDTWTTVHAESNGNGGTDDIDFTEQSIQYIRVNCVTRATQYGSSIWEVQIKSDDECHQAPVNWELVWSDEFEGTAIDTANWNWEIGDSGWGNNELEYYTNNSENSYIENGSLVIAARKDHLGHDYTSARMTTKNKQSFLYGRLEARIKLPEGGQGIWPAFWMLGNDIGQVGWPQCGEIDILEVINEFTSLHGTLHYGTGDPYVHDSNGGSYSPAVDLSDDYHIYAIEWEPAVIRWYFDDVNFYTTSNWWGADDYPDPFDQEFFFILNIAVGGNWPGYPNETTPFPQYMYIDYIRVYRNPGQ